MLRVARPLGLIYLVSGVLCLVSPEAARRLIYLRVGVLRSLAGWSLEFARLSPGAMRLLGGSLIVVGAMLASAGPEPSALGLEAQVRAQSRPSPSTSYR
jgi:hypothetical protein